MRNTVREPKQGRSIETKNKIIEAGYKLFSDVGYYGTNTAEIAKLAGVSTGIIYGYFQDKRDILICALDIYINKVIDPIFKYIDKLQSPIDFSLLITNIVDMVISTHKRNRKMHEALHALSPTDEVVNSEFIELENQITHRAAEKFAKLGVNIENPFEKIHYAMDVIQSFAHEFVFDKHDYIDYSVMRELMENSLEDLFKNG